VVADPDSLRTQLQKHGDRLRDADDRRREEHEAIAQLVPAALDETLEFFREVRRIGWEEPILLDQFPFREDPVEAARTSIETMRLIDGALDRLDLDALAEAQAHQDAVAAQRLVLDLLLAR
jgi:xylose isomerase